MELPLLAALVVGGVTAVVALTVLLGWSASATLDATAARARFLLDFPDARIVELRLGDEGRAALLQLDDPIGSVGLVAVLGDRTFTRRLTGAGVRRVLEDDAGLTIHLRDTGAPSLRVGVSDPAARGAWRARLGAL